MDGALQRCAEHSKLSGRLRYHSEINDKNGLIIGVCESLKLNKEKITNI